MQNILKGRRFQSGAVHLAFLAIFALAAIVGATSWFTTQKTNFENKAATSCGTITGSGTCNNAPGCQWIQTLCESFSQQACPKDKCQNIYTQGKSCSSLSEQPCLRYTGECTANYQTAKCIGISDRFNSHCSPLGYGTCTNLTNRSKCKWQPKVFTSCSGKYTQVICRPIAGAEPPETCGSCSKWCTKTTTFCGGGNTTVEKCNPNQCGSTVLQRCPAGTTCREGGGVYSAACI